LVALGFVLIYKASGIFNYAQGVMALFAALTLVGIMDGQVPFSHLINAALGTSDITILDGMCLPLASFCPWAVMVIWLGSFKKVIFRHLVNGQEPIILFMATIGLAYFMEGLGDIMWGSDIKKLDVGLPQGINMCH
jgi:branched-chain amino acid transport system permease protein